MRRAARCVIAIVIAVWSIAAAPDLAQADTFFVSKSGSGTSCTEGAPCLTITDALATSRATSGTGDEIQIGPGVYAERVVVNNPSDAGLTLRGAGRGPDLTETPSGATTLRSPESNKGDAIAVSVASGVSIEDLRVEVPAGFINGAGISLGAPMATIRGDQVQSAGNMNAEAIYVTAGTPEARILETRVRQIGTYRAIAIFGPKATVADSDVLSANEGAVDTEFPATETQILRSRLQAGNTVVTARSPEVVIDSSLLVGGSQGLEAYASFSAANGATLSNDTIDVGTPKQIASGTAIRARAENGGTASVTLVNSIALEKIEVAGTAAAGVSCFTSMVGLHVETATAGTISCGSENGNAFAPPGTLFVPGSDWHLQPGSPAVDTGAGGDALSPSDLDGAPRIADGNGDGTAVIDRGAYELPTPTPDSAGARGAVGPSNVFKFRKLKRNRRRGTAKLQVEVPGPGSLVLSGKRVRSFTREAKGAETIALKIVPKQKLARRLRSKGSAHTSVSVTFTPTGGSARTRAKALRLIG